MKEQEDVHQSLVYYYLYPSGKDSTEDVPLRKKNEETTYEWKGQK